MSVVAASFLIDIGTGLLFSGALIVLVVLIEIKKTNLRAMCFRLLEWRTGVPDCNGDFLVQRSDSSFAVATWWVGATNWSCMGEVVYWRELKGPIRKAS